ncbi:aldehyde dehydrogenase family protein [Paraburkholderia fungorum]|uniref:aldehyde dehydrogenase family protein n=1 Tax=Paraburkholderia fungorum TaxID=134537 RepID=UPI0038BC8421
MSDGRSDTSELALPVRPVDFRAGAARRFDVLSAYDGMIIESVSDVDFHTLAATFKAGLRAAEKLQSTRVVQERLRTWARRIAVRREQLVRIISVETGKPIRFARVEVDAALAVLGSYCECPSIQLQREWTPAQAAYSILNWCDPVLATVTEAATVLSSGRALVIKPSSRAPLASLALAAYWKEGDDLDALLCVVPSTDAVGMLRASLMTPRVTEVRFRGSRDVGTFVSRACQEAAVPVTVSPGERLPLVLYSLADVGAQCDVILNLAFLQPLLSSAERVSCLYVHDYLADVLIPMLLEKVSQLRIGDPLNDETDIGPVIDDVAVALVTEQIEDALSTGASLGGGQVEPDGRRMQPMILDKAQPFMRVCVEEREGPLLPIIRFSAPSELPATTCLTIHSVISTDMHGYADQAITRCQGAH